jgi:ketosteroid isomerase-like protein
MSQENVEMVRRGADAFNRRDAEGFGVLLAPDAEIVPLRAALEGTVYRGPAAATEFFADSDESWENLHVEVEEIRDGGECILAFGRLWGRGRGSGVDTEMPMAWVVRFRDGQITTFRAYTDPDEAAEAAGLSE